MSSFGKNLIPRRAHKERAQPSSRVARHGLLEKKQDYKLRARDRNRKKLRVKLLKEKAAFRNPDEFYYGMARSATDGGRVRRVANRAEGGRVPLAQRSAEEKMLAETQDGGYVGVKAGREGGRVRRLREGLHFLGAAAVTRRQHVVFVDDEEQMEQVTKGQGDEGEGERVEEEKSMNRAAKRRLKKRMAKAYRELEQRAEREEKLKTVLRDLDAEKMLLSKGRRSLVRAGDPLSGAPPVYRWHQERKR